VEEIIPYKNSEENMDYTRTLAKFCSQVSIDMLPEEVIHKAKLCTLDYIANIYGSLELEAVKNLISYVKSLKTSGRATALGCGFKTDVHNAAFINGTTAEAIEAQDGLRFGGNHPGTAVIPAAIAIAEDMNRGGRDIIGAIVAGYEAADRPAAAMHPHHTLSGFLPTGTCGTFGAAAAATLLRGYGEDTMRNALGNAGYLTPISMAEQLMGGYTIKIVQGGQAASAGIMAAELAAAGITGAPYVFEGSDLQGGFTQITTAKTGGSPQFEKLTEKLGEHYSIMDIYFKPYTACRHTHGAAQATLELAKEKEINPEDIEAVQVYTYGIATIAVGKGVTDNDTFVSAQFSIPYVVAACLLDGELSPRQLTEKRMADPAVIDLSKKIRVDMDEALNSVYPEKTSSRIEITMKDGEKLIKQVDIPKGDPRDPIDGDYLSAKVKSFAGDRDAKIIKRIIDLVLNLEEVKNIGEVTDII
jgi:2-methylcitrate dehydratase PrpD